MHVEACTDVAGTLNRIRECGLRTAISFNPETEVEELLPYLPLVDMVLVMSVRPGFGGQKFIMSSLDKVRYLDRMRNEQKLDFAIEIDGGVKRSNLEEIVTAGVDVVVAGTAVFDGDIAENVKVMRR